MNRNEKIGMKNKNWAWWHIPMMSALESLRQEDHGEEGKRRGEQRKVEDS
jgi:hypothetical protein